MKRLFAVLLCLGLALSLAACSADPAPTPGTSVDPPPSVVSDPVSPSPEPEGSESPSPEVPPSESPSAEPSADPSPVVTEEPAPTPTLPVYEFGTPLAQTEVVEDSHFENVAFLGDSRTEGLQLFGGLYYGDYFWARGMTVFRVNDPNYAIFEIDGEMHTMIGALSKKEYDAVYIMVGVNELGYETSSYESGMAKFIDLVLEAQPNAVVYLQLLPPVNETVAHQSGLADYINNERINQFNAAIVRVATEKKVVLLNTAEAYRDENGELPAELASDGCHFNFGGYTLWTDYLRCHVMDKETYHFSRAQQSAPEPSPEPDSSGEPSVEPEPGEEPVETPSGEPSDPPEAETEQEEPEV